VVQSPETFMAARREPSVVCALLSLALASSYTMAPTKSNRKQASTSIINSKKKLSAASVVGAPAQHNQSSRKGKKAWRKNVDIEDFEEKLEGLREEERTFGCGFLSYSFSSKFECDIQAYFTEEDGQRTVCSRYQGR
jgi:hypothetical protein